VQRARRAQKWLSDPLVFRFGNSEDSLDKSNWLNVLLDFENFTIDTDRRELKSADSVIRVEPQVFDLLVYLAQNTNRVISKDELIKHVWHGRIVSDAALNSRINFARRAINDSGKKQRCIRTVARHGFLFGAEVRTRNNNQTEPVPTDVASSSPKFSERPSIAVLPFLNMSGDPEQEYFADGMVDEIVTGLSRIKWLSVISRNSSFIYKNKPMPVKEIATKFGVRYLLQGGVRKSGSRLRITAQLIDAESDTHLWAEQYDRFLKDVFDLQDEITMCVVGAIEPSLRRAELDRIKRQRPNNLNAYDLLLRSQQSVFAGMPGEAAKAIPLLEEALKIESDYGVAHAYLSWCLHSRFGRGGLREEDRLAAVDHARKAIALGNDDATALAIAALVLAYDGHDTIAALKVFDRALELSNCNIFVLCWNAAILAWIGKTDLAIERAQRALRLGPFDSLIWRAHHALSIAYFYDRRYQDAAEAARNVIDANPVYSLPRAILAAALMRLGRREEASAMAQTVLEREPTFTIRGTAVYAELKPAVFRPFADAWRELRLPT
jgi:adenylate cyclase